MNYETEQAYELFSKALHNAVYWQNLCDDLTVTDGLHQAKYCTNAIRARGETK